MTWVLNDTVVPQVAYEDCRRIKGASGKCHLMLPEVYQLRNPSICINCGGIGEIIIETIVGGPQPSPMRVEPNSGAATTCIDDQWYKRKLNSYICVVCNGTGKSRPEYSDDRETREQVREMQL